MKRLTLLLLLLLFLPVGADEREFTLESGVVMKQYYLLLYVRGENAQDFDEEELKNIQAGHLAHIGRMTEEGVVVIAGPFGDDTEKRGILIFDVPTLEEVEDWIRQDPAVKAGRLDYEIHPWWGAKGASLK